MKARALAAVPVLALMLVGLVTGASAKTVGETNRPLAEQVRHQLACFLGTACSIICSTR